MKITLPHRNVECILQVYLLLRWLAPALPAYLIAATAVVVVVVVSAAAYAYVGALRCACKLRDALKW